VGRLKLHSYGLMVFIAFVFGIYLGERRAKRAGLAAGVVTDLSVWLMISSLLGARLTYVGAHLSEFRGRWLDAVSPFQSDGTVGIAGLVLLGGVAAALPASAIYLKRKRIPFAKMADLLAPSLVFGIAIGRIGCFLNGCCFGSPTSLPWGTVFPNDCYAGYIYPDQHLHPTQLYEMLGCAIVGAYLLWWTARRRFEGELFCLFLALYGVIRMPIESIRYYRPDLVPLHLGPLQVTGSMLVSAAMIIAGGVLLVRGYRGPKSG